MGRLRQQAGRPAAAQALYPRVAEPVRPAAVKRAALAREAALARSGSCATFTPHAARRVVPYWTTASESEPGLVAAGNDGNSVALVYSCSCPYSLPTSHQTHVEQCVTAAPTPGDSTCRQGPLTVAFRLTSARGCRRAFRVKPASIPGPRRSSPRRVSRSASCKSQRKHSPVVVSSKSVLG